MSVVATIEKEAKSERTRLQNELKQRDAIAAARAVALDALRVAKERCDRGEVPHHLVVLCEQEFRAAAGRLNRLVGEIPQKLQNGCTDPELRDGLRQALDQQKDARCLVARVENDLEEIRRRVDVLIPAQVEALRDNQGRSSSESARLDNQLRLESAQKLLQRERAEAKRAEVKLADAKVARDKAQAAVVAVKQQMVESSL